MKRFCYGCKEHIDLPTQDAKEFNKIFSGAGHTGQPVARLQRDQGRKQRRDKWQSVV